MPARPASLRQLPKSWQRAWARKDLTARELAVLERIVAGRANKEIASDLTISEATVKTHVNNLLSKLGVSDRTNAATVAIQRGLVHFNKAPIMKLSLVLLLSILISLSLEAQSKTGWRFRHDGGA